MAASTSVTGTDVRASPSTTGSTPTATATGRTIIIATVTTGARVTAARARATTARGWSVSAKGPGQAPSRVTGYPTGTAGVLQPIAQTSARDSAAIRATRRSAVKRGKVLPQAALGRHGTARTSPAPPRARSDRLPAAATTRSGSARGRARMRTALPPGRSRNAGRMRKERHARPNAPRLRRSDATAATPFASAHVTTNPRPRPIARVSTPARPTRCVAPAPGVAVATRALLIAIAQPRG